MNAVDWTIVETTEAGFTPTQLHHKETVFTLSNGYLGTRGSFEEGYPGGCPATLINGVYDQAPIVFTELANCPDWLSLTITIGGERFRMDQGEILKYQRWLNLYRGVLSRRVSWRSPAGHTINLNFERFVSMADQHVLALRCEVTSVDFAGEIEVHSSLNGYADTQGLLHWDCLDQAAKAHTIWLQARTHHSKIELGMAARLSLLDADDAQIIPVGFQGYPTLMARLQIQPGRALTIEKVVTVFTSRETSQPLKMAIDKLSRLSAYPVLLATHEAVWAGLWQTSDVVLEGDLTAQLAVRYNLFQLLSATPRHDDRISIPAKTLSGFAYRGHVFWDTEIFLLPCLTLTHPTLARNLLAYRYHTLEGARRKAKAAGYEGAMYAWESAETGDEVTPTWVPAGTSKEVIRIWCGDLEVHINTDIAYAIWHYWKATKDDVWMQDFGIEIILDTAVFWGSRVVWNPDRQCYDLHDVIGPDENHERVNNNTFTNRFVQWHLEIALKLLGWLRQTNPQKANQLQQQLNLTPERLNHWQHIIQQVYLPKMTENGLIEQFQGFFALEDINLAEYEPRSRSMQALLGIEGARERQVLKQADVLMLLYLLREEVMGESEPCEYDRQTLLANWNYYAPRTDHTYGSSLGPPIHATLACKLGKLEEAYEHFMRAALVDLSDVRGNAHEGIHAASTGGVWQAVVFGFGGIKLTAQGPVATPNLPAHWSRLQFKLLWQGQLYEFDLQPAKTSKKPESTVMPIAQTFVYELDSVLTNPPE